MNASEKNKAEEVRECKDMNSYFIIAFISPFHVTKYLLPSSYYVSGPVMGSGEAIYVCVCVCVCVCVDGWMDGWMDK